MLHTISMNKQFRPLLTSGRAQQRYWPVCRRTSQKPRLLRAAAENQDTPAQAEVKASSEVGHHAESTSPTIDTASSGSNGTSNGSSGTNGSSQASTTNSHYTKPAETAPELTSSPPEGWQGLTIWLAKEPARAEGQDDIVKALHGIRKGFMRGFKENPTNSGTHTSVNGNGVKPKTQGVSHEVNNTALHEAILSDTVKYGEMVQAVYDTLLTKDVYSRYFGNCVPGVMVEGQELGDSEVLQYTQLGDDARKYKVLTRIQADSGAYKLVVKKDRNYVGFIAEGPADANGAVDIAIVFRGTITRDEWIQDAKALKVRWRNGEQVVSPPNILLTASPFKGDVRVALSIFVGTLVLLSSTYGEHAVANVTSALSDLSAFCLNAGGASAVVCLVLQTLIEAFAGSFTHAVDGMQHVFAQLQVDPAQVPLLSHSAVAGATAWVVWGIFAGLYENPGDWLGNTWKLLSAVGPWMWFGVVSLADGFCGVPLNEPRVSYGFKEMYCDALPKCDCKTPLNTRSAPNGTSTNGKPGTSNGNGAAVAAAGNGSSSGAAPASNGNGTNPEGTELNESPRLTILKTLAGLLKDGKKIKSITITGHSLGAALASLCGFDLSTALTEALQVREATSKHGWRQLLAARLSETISEGAEQLKAAAPEVVSNAATGLVEACTGTGDLLDMYKKTNEQRDSFIGELSKLSSTEVPAVAVVSFAGPRVGDLNYSKAFTGRSIMCPMGVLEPFWDGKYRPGVGNKCQSFLRDFVIQVSKMPWYVVGLMQLATNSPNAAAKNHTPSSATGPQEQGVSGVDAEPQPDAPEAVTAGAPDPTARARVGMLRIVNAHDLVPNLPLTLPLPWFMFVHGGHELLLNSYLVTYFKNGLLGPSVGARHNMEMYVHLLDPSRDKALVNKSDSVLTPDKKIPDDWWCPLPHKGMTWDDQEKKWKRPE